MCVRSKREEFREIGPLTAVCPRQSPRRPFAPTFLIYIATARNDNIRTKNEEKTEKEVRRKDDLARRDWSFSSTMTRQSLVLTIVRADV